MRDMMHPQLPSHADIVVAGGGPAGATIARLLAQFGYGVVLLEKRQFPRHQIGESLTPQILPILDFVGVRRKVGDEGFLRMVGHTVCWGSVEPRTSYYSPDLTRYGFQAWRADFDTLLLSHARNTGVQVVEGLAVDDVRLESGAPATVYTRQGTLTADFFIDATGHAGVLARQRLRRRDTTYRTLAVTGYWRGATGPAGVDFANTLLETYRGGLVWSVPLHNGLRNVTLLTDWDEGAQIRRAGLDMFYRAQLRQSPYISGFLAAARLARPLQVFDATWYTARYFAGERFLLVGDAGLFIDPLSSEGVHKAMASAITGAIVANTILRRPTMTPHAVRFYNEGQQSTYEGHYQQSAQYYREELRWSEQPFWRKRSTRDVRSAECEAWGSESVIHNPKSFLTDTRRPIPNNQRISALHVAPEVTIEQRPVIEGPYVELREVVVAPRYPRGVRTLQQVYLPRLLGIVRRQSAVSTIMTQYLATPEGKQCPAESIRQVLARLYQEGILVSTDASDTG
jgi:flavin-dependent dehydrogenase